MIRIGSGYCSSEDFHTTTSKENEEIIPELVRKDIQMNGFLTFTFLNDDDCTVIVNGVDEIKLRAKQGMITGFEDAPITSFKIKEKGTSYYYLAEW